MTPNHFDQPFFFSPEYPKPLLSHQKFFALSSFRALLTHFIHILNFLHIVVEYVSSPFGQYVNQGVYFL